MSEKSCDRCEHFQPLNQQQGECRLNPPKIVMATVSLRNGLETTCVWPAVGKTQWCSKFQLKFSKEEVH